MHVAVEDLQRAVERLSANFERPARGGSQRLRLVKVAVDEVDQRPKVTFEAAQVSFWNTHSSQAQWVRVEDQERFSVLAHNGQRAGSIREGNSRRIS